MHFYQMNNIRRTIPRMVIMTTMMTMMMMMKTMVITMMMKTMVIMTSMMMIMMIMITKNKLPKMWMFTKSFWKDTRQVSISCQSQLNLQPRYIYIDYVDIYVIYMSAVTFVAIVIFSQYLTILTFIYNR